MPIASGEVLLLPAQIGILTRPAWATAVFYASTALDVSNQYTSQDNSSRFALERTSRGSVVICCLQTAAALPGEPVSKLLFLDRVACSGYKSQFVWIQTTDFRSLGMPYMGFILALAVADYIDKIGILNPTLACRCWNHADP